MIGTMFWATVATRRIPPNTIAAVSTASAIPSAMGSQGSDSGSVYAPTAPVTASTMVLACSEVKAKAKQKMNRTAKIGRARLNSSHVAISYAVFCLKKKKNKHEYVTQ